MLRRLLFTLFLAMSCSLSAQAQTSSMLQLTPNDESYDPVTLTTPPQSCGGYATTTVTANANHANLFRVVYERFDPDAGGSPSAVEVATKTVSLGQTRTFASSVDFFSFSKLGWYTFHARVEYWDTNLLDWVQIGGEDCGSIEVVESGSE